MNFENSVKKVDEIISKLSAGDVPLDDCWFSFLFMIRFSVWLSSSATAGRSTDGTPISTTTLHIVSVSSRFNSRCPFHSLWCSFLVTGLGILSCLMNIYLLPFLIIRLNVPIPYISLSAGLVLCKCCFLFWRVVVANVVMGASNTLFGAIIGSIFLEIGYNLSTSAPSSIISVGREYSFGV